MNKPYFLVLERYSQRYYIEHIFRDLKQLYLFNNFHKSDLANGFEFHILLCVMRYDFIQQVKQENHWMKKTNGQVIRMIRKWLLSMSEIEREKWFSVWLKGEFKFSKFN